MEKVQSYPMLIFPSGNRPLLLKFPDMLLTLGKLQTSFPLFLALKIHLITSENFNSVDEDWNFLL